MVAQNGQIRAPALGPRRQGRAEQPLVMSRIRLSAGVRCLALLALCQAVMPRTM
jgi:hypothetical protein